jgi:hypothetical protein
MWWMQNLFSVHLHSICLTYISVQVLRRDEKAYALLTSCEGPWCVNKRGPSPCNSPRGVWCCLVCLRNPYVHVGVVHCQIQEFHLWQRSEQKLWESILYISLIPFCFCYPCFCEHHQLTRSDLFSKVNVSKPSDVYWVGMHYFAVHVVVGDQWHVTWKRKICILK